MESYQIRLSTPLDKMTINQRNEVVDFLKQHLEQYGDAKKDIEKAIAYALQEHSSPGGFVLTALNEHQIAGAVVVNKTGMGGYIPENILVYIAVHQNFRGKGLGKKLMLAALENCDGDIALHVEPENPARLLYEKLGFKNKYLEMRYRQQ